MGCAQSLRKCHFGGLWDRLSTGRKLRQVGCRKINQYMWVLSGVGEPKQVVRKDGGAGIVQQGVKVYGAFGQKS